MADQRITELGPITGAQLNDNDPFVVVDRSDPTMAPSGTNKQLVFGELKSRLTLDGFIDGGGFAGEIAVFTGPTTIGGNVGFTFDGATLNVDGDVDITGQYLINGTPIGGGGGTIGGTIALNEVAFGTGPDTISGSSQFTYDGSVFTVDGDINTGTIESNSFFVAPNAFSTRRWEVRNDATNNNLVVLIESGAGTGTYNSLYTLNQSGTPANTNDLITVGYFNANVPAAGIGGTIAQFQVAFGTAADTIGGSNNLSWDGTTLDVVGSVVADFGLFDGATPQLAILGDGAGSANVASFDIADSNGDLQGYIGFENNTNNTMIFANNVVGTAIELDTAGGLDGLKYFDGSTVQTVYHSGNLPPAGAVTWGSITGTLSNQTDLQSALDAKPGITGTPASNEIAVWSGANSIQRFSNFTFDGTQFRTPTNSYVFHLGLSLGGFIRLWNNSFPNFVLRNTTTGVGTVFGGFEDNAGAPIGRFGWYDSVDLIYGMYAETLDQGFGIDSGGGSQSFRFRSGTDDWAVYHEGNPPPGGGIGGLIGINEIAVGAGGNNIEGDSLLTWDGTFFNAQIVRAVGPAGSGNFLRVGGTSTGTANVSYMSFYESDRTTRQGYLGFGSGSNSTMYMVNDVGGNSIQLTAADEFRYLVGSTTHFIVESSGLATASLGFRSKAFTAENPNNNAATVSLDWLNDAPRLRIGGSGTGSSAAFTIQGTSNVVRMTVTSSGSVQATEYLYSDAGRLYLDGKYALRGTDTYLRLNEGNAFTSGVYTQGNLRTDGTFDVGSSGLNDWSTTRLRVYASSLEGLQLRPSTAGTDGFYIRALNNAGNNLWYFGRPSSTSSYAQWYSYAGLNYIRLADNGTNLIGGDTTFNDIVTGANFVLSSDMRKKKFVRDAKPELINAKWRRFQLKGSNSGKERWGVVAQELMVKHPEFVYEGDDGMLGVSYTDLLVAKVVELEWRIKRMEENFRITPN